MVGFALVACGMYPEVRQADVVSWRSVPVIELERHPFFSTLTVDKRPLSDGSELWDYPHCISGKTNTQCTSNNNGYGGVNTNCVGGQQYTNCCHNQFIVRASTVEEYRPMGSCYTDCSVRPGGACRD